MSKHSVGEAEFRLLVLKALLVLAKQVQNPNSVVPGARKDLEDVQAELQAMKLALEAGRGAGANAKEKAS